MGDETCGKNTEGNEMIYPRQLENGELVLAEQMVTYLEHMQREHRILFLNGVMTAETSCQDLIMTLDSLSHKPIRLVITSPGGDLDMAFLLYDTIRMVKSPIETLGRYCASAAAIVLAIGRKRYLYPHAKTMLHLPAGQMAGDSKDWDIQHQQMEGYRNQIVEILCECGAKKMKKEILADMDRDFWMKPQETIEYGLADRIMDKKTWAKWIS